MIPKEITNLAELQDFVYLVAPHWPKNMEVVLWVEFDVYKQILRQIHDSAIYIKQNHTQNDRITYKFMGLTVELKYIQLTLKPSLSIEAQLHKQSKWK